jgi:hypothetical protein
MNNTEIVESRFDVVKGRTYASPRSDQIPANSKPWKNHQVRAKAEEMGGQVGRDCRTSWLHDWVYSCSPHYQQ